MFWYALRSKPNKEMALWHEIRARPGVFLSVSVREACQSAQSQHSPLFFPGYLFLHADIEQIGFSTLQWMPFSLGLVSFGSQPAIIPESLVQAIRQRVKQVNAAGGEQHPGLKPGQEVVISGGPFSGYEAVFDLSLHGTQRVRVLLKLLGRKQLPLELPAGYIQQINRA